MALVVTIGGVVRTSVTVQGSVYVEQRAADFISVCGLRIVDVGAVINIAAEAAILLNDDVTGEVFFGGRVVDIGYQMFGGCTSRYIDIKCQDPNYQLGETVIDQVEEFPGGAGHGAITADADIIDHLFDDYLPAVDSVAHVDTLQDPLTITFNPCTLRNMLSQICTRTGGYFYIDFDNELHYFDAEAAGVGWWLSDTPDQVNSFSYLLDPLDMATVATTVLDGVFVIGSEVSGWRGVHAPGDRQGIARDNRITTAQGIIDRGDAVLGKYGAPQTTYVVTTYKAGLRAGYDVRFVCGVYGVDDTLTVRIMVVKWDGCGVPYYVLTLGDVVNPSLIAERHWIDGLTDSLTITAPMLPTSSRGWTQDLVFSATDHNTVAWAGGDIVLADGTTYTIGGGDTGDMAATTYIYLDLDVADNVLQTTDDAAVAVGSRILLVAWATPQAVGLEATFIAFGGEGQGSLVDTANIVDAAITAIKAGNALQNWSHTLVFSSADHDTVEWAGGNIYLADGTTYNIVGGDTGNMIDITYIYLDTDVSIVALQTTTSATNAIGNNRILVAVAKNVAAGKLATFQTFGGSGLGVMITAGQIVANTITANEILGNTITAAEIAAGTITANEIAALTITAAELAANCVTSDKILANTIVAGDIAVGTITSNEIAANTILAGNIAAGAIETDELAALAVTAGKIAANTITADKISMGIGDEIFNAADGLLLLGPHCEISTTAWTSLRKQVAVISGAFHQEAGRWLGTRGLVVEEATTNLITNPSFEVDLTGWTETDADASMTPSQDGAISRFGDYSLKLVNTDAGDDDYMSFNVAGPDADTKYTITAWANVTAFTAGAIGNRGLFGWDTANAGTLQMTTITAATNGWERHQITVTTTAAPGDLQVRLYGPQGTVYWDGVQIEKKAYATSYCDGTLGTGYAWTGAAHGSTSTRAATTVNLDSLGNLISANNTVSFRCVVQVLYDADATQPGFSTFFDLKGADNNNRIFCRTNVAGDDKLMVYINGGYRLVGSVAETYSAGDYLDIIVTLDFANDLYALYRNGVEVDTDATVLAAPAAIVDWALGGECDGSRSDSMIIVEYAVFDRVLTAIEVAGMYALQRPTVDIAALEKPGIHLMEIVSGDLDDIDDGTTYSKVLTTSITAGKIILSETTGDLDDIDDGATYGRLRQTIIGAGFVQVGAGTKDADLDGISIDNTELVTQAAGVDQVVIGVDGKLKAGAGAVRMDAGGLYMVGAGASGDMRRLRFLYDDAGAIKHMGSVYGNYGGPGATYSWLSALRVAGDPWTGSIVILQAFDDVAASDVRITVNSDGNVGIGGSLLTINGDVNVDGGQIQLRAATGNNILLIPDNLADGFHVQDTGDAHDYITIETANDSREVVINQDEFPDMDFRVAANGVANAIFVNGATGNTGLRMAPTDDGRLCIGLATENFEVMDAGSVDATEQDWVEVQIGGVTGYIRIFNAK